ncbi:PTS sugar transporter subunit IIB [bacterium]|nr:PTS sugar transporter subunit IIB [bacterium]
MELKNFTLRIDDRLIHGQVNVGWLQPLNKKNVYIVDDRSNNDFLTKSLWDMSIPPGTHLNIFSHEQFRSKLPSLDLNDSMLLVRSVEDCFALLSGCGMCFSKINVGGLHYSEDSREIFPYLFLSTSDIQIFEKMIDKGIKLCLQLTCNSAKIMIDTEFIEKVKGSCT